MRGLGAALACLALGGCATIGKELSTQAYDQRYTGEIQPMGGVHCTDSMPATLVTRAADLSVVFTPNDGALVIRGSMSRDGQVLARLNTAPPNRPPYLLSLEGRVEKAGFSGVYQTPQCAWKVVLYPAVPLPHHYVDPKNALGIPGN
ncbi:MAG: hypothetical protein ACP5M5_08585 [Acidibrevibacterium sp.]|uniref:hypothetical protein n=1 Tax=Acidibrevibacterium sp. TaxID=2606776 RepID=UPI003CFE4FA5